MFQGRVAVGPETKSYTCAYVSAYNLMLPRICISKIILIYRDTTSQPVLNYPTGQTTNRLNTLALDYISIGDQNFNVLPVWVSSELLLCFSYLSHEKGGTVIDLNDVACIT